MTVGRWLDTENILSPEQQLQSTPLLRFFLKNKSQFLREQIQAIDIRQFTAKALGKVHLIWQGGGDEDIETRSSKF